MFNEKKKNYCGDISIGLEYLSFLKGSYLIEEYYGKTQWRKIYQGIDGLYITKIKFFTK